MKREEENQPIDDLFARKLGSLSSPPSADSFERLQARMNQRHQKSKVVVWRNPVVQRYMAIAASLFLVCLFGWLYWPNTAKVNPQVAIKQRHHSDEGKNPEIKAEASIDVAKIDQSRIVEENVEEIKSRTAKVSKISSPKTHLIPVDEHIMVKSSVLPTHVDAVEASHLSTPVRTNDSNKPNVMSLPALERLAENSPKVNVPVERVLVVTIEEPAVLAAARQTKTSTDEKVRLTTNESDPKEAKGNGIWQQVKRFKQGELFAQHKHTVNDDQGLLSRAYAGLKQSFDKSKSTKQ